MRIALFGGSFDPPHLGHVLAATYAFSMARVDEVWVLPVNKHAYGKPISSWKQRWELCEAAFGKLGFVRLRDDELENVEGYTYTLLERLRAKHPDTQWFLVGGTDTSLDLPNWYHGAELMKQIEIIAVPRQGYDRNHPAALPAISSTMVRDHVQRNLPIADLVPAAVANLIRKNGWYR
jgi:nicotinate-nucleotide adenylyltransferase